MKPRFSPDFPRSRSVCKRAAALCAAAFAAAAGAETVIASLPSPAPIDAPIPRSAISQADVEDGWISIWIKPVASTYDGWHWSLRSKPDQLYVTDGARTSELLNQVNAAWGDLGSLAPSAPFELKFSIEGLDVSSLRFHCANGNGAAWFLHNGTRPAGEIGIEVWKGARLDASMLSGRADKANRSAFASVTGASGTNYVWTVDGKSYSTDQPRFRRRFAEKPEPVEFKVKVMTRKDGDAEGTLVVEPRETTLVPPIPDGETLFGHVVYSWYGYSMARDLSSGKEGNLMCAWSNGNDNMTNLAFRAQANANGVYLMNIYAPSGFGRANIEALDEAYPGHYLRNSVGEYASYLYQGRSSAGSIPMDLDLEKARRYFTDVKVPSYVRNMHNTWDWIYTTSGAPLTTYELAGGMDYAMAELYAMGAANLAYATAEMRGAARKWGPEFWGGWLAHEWQTTGIPYNTPEKYASLVVGLFQQYLMGTSMMILESGGNSLSSATGITKENLSDTHNLGVFGVYTSSNPYRQGYEEAYPRRYRAAVREVYDWSRKNPRDPGTPETSIALAIGANDADVGLDNQTIWAQHDNSAADSRWKTGPAESGWRRVRDLFFPLPKDALGQFNNRFLAGSPFGQVDIVAVDEETRLSDLARYKLLVLPGWNTMSPELLAALDEWVSGGGTLVAAVPQFSTRVDREQTDYAVSDLVNGGDLRPLVDATVLDRGGDAAIMDAEPDADGFVVKKRGAGEVHLYASWPYPGAKESLWTPWTNRIARLAAAVPQTVTVSGADAAYVSFATYSDHVYALNVDTQKSRTAVLNGFEIALTNGEMKALSRAALAPPAAAETYVWTGGASGDWGLVANWSVVNPATSALAPATQLPGADDTFAGATANCTIDLGGSVAEIGGIAFGGGYAAGRTIRIANGTLRPVATGSEIPA
ncbi:MAG: hypothetical protein IJ678_07720, partial [Kiritimatiellae bacterium]|nr:hypothetical protein [Kiritimatiellia bacterium]